MDANEVREYVKSRLSSDPSLKGGFVLAELLESIGLQPKAALQTKRMGCEAIVASYLEYLQSSKEMTPTPIRKRIRAFSTMKISYTNSNQQGKFWLFWERVSPPLLESLISVLREDFTIE